MREANSLAKRISVCWTSTGSTDGSAGFVTTGVTVRTVRTASAGTSAAVWSTFLQPVPSRAASRLPAAAIPKGTPFLIGWLSWLRRRAAAMDG